MQRVIFGASLLVLLLTVTLFAQEKPIAPVPGRLVVLDKRAYVASFDQFTGCTNGPIVKRNSLLFRLAPNSGSEEAVIVNHGVDSATCYLTGLGYHYSGNPALYAVSSGMTGQWLGSNRVHGVKGDGTFVPHASLVENTGADFYVDEIEFDSSGSAYLLKKGDTSHVFRVEPVIFKGGGAITVGAPIYTVPGAPLPARPLTLVASGSQDSIWVVFQATAYSPLLVREISGTSSKPSVTKPSHGKPGGWGPMTDNISGYYDGVYLYIFRGDTLYRMNGSESGPPEVVGKLTSIAETTSHDMAYVP